MKKKASDFYSMFVGEHVMLVLKQCITKSYATEDGSSVEESPLVYEGYMMDMDDTYFFLGFDAKSISMAVLRTEVVSISVTEKEEKDDFSVDNMEIN
jgi:hypothetical protein